MERVEQRSGGVLLGACFFVLFSFCFPSLCPLCLCGSTSPPTKLDPAAWGGDHVGKPVPEYETANECLFCHRDDVGSSWSSNRHNRTIRALEPTSPALAALKKLPTFKELPGEVEFVLGANNR